MNSETLKIYFSNYSGEPCVHFEFDIYNKFIVIYLDKTLYIDSNLQDYIELKNTLDLSEEEFFQFSLDCQYVNPYLLKNIQIHAKHLIDTIIDKKHRFSTSLTNTFEY